MTESGDGLPKVEGLTEFVKQNLDNPQQDKGQSGTGQVQEPPAQQQVQTPPSTPDAGQVEDADLAGILKTFTTPDGKVNTKDLLKSYKEIQGFTTRVSQENKDKAKVIEELQTKFNQLQEEAELRRYQAPATPHTQQKSFEEMFLDNPEQAITAKAMEIANTQRITEVLEEKRYENPDDFPERMGYVNMLVQNPQYAQLQYSPKGVAKLFEIADKTRAQMLTRKAHESLKVIFGEDVDLDALKALVKGSGGAVPPVNQIKPQQTFANAYMPDTSTSTRTGADLNMNQIETIKQEALKNGDPSAVAGALLKEALLK